MKMKSEQKKILPLLKFSENEKKSFFKKVENEYKQLLFDSVYINKPKQIFLILNEELENFLLYIQTGDIQIPYSCGKYAISKGLTEHIIFSFFHIVQNLILTRNKHDREVILKTTNEYLKHYII